MDSESENEDIVLAIILSRRRRRRKNRATWVHPYLTRRNELSEFHNLVSELRVENKDLYFTYFRMFPSTMDHLLSLVGPSIRKYHTQFREPISEKERLALTLRYLATGDSMQTVAFSMRVGRSTTSHIIRDTCGALWEALQRKYLPAPSLAQFTTISRDFWLKWQYPNCLGAIDGKHIRIQAPHNSGSDYYNYKKFFSIVLLAITDAQYRFVTVDIGDSGHHSDSGILTNSAFWRAMTSGKIAIPAPANLPGSNEIIPHMFIGDGGFPLNKFLMRPYNRPRLPRTQRIFNYRLSRARRIVENTFGILTARWRILLRPIIASEETTLEIIKAICVLHNFLRQIVINKTFDCENRYCPPSFMDRENQDGEVIPGEWRNDAGFTQLRSLGRQGSRNNTRQCEEIREKLCQFFNSEIGMIAWQDSQI